MQPFAHEMTVTIAACDAPSTWRAELTQLTAVEMSRQGWWALGSLRSLHTGWKVGSFPPRFATHKVRCFVYVLTEVVIAGSFFKKRKFAKGQPRAWFYGLGLPLLFVCSISVSTVWC